MTIVLTRSISFDGVNDYGSFGNHSSLRPSSAFTFACWHYSLSGGSASDRLIAFPQTSGPNWDRINFSVKSIGFYDGSTLKATDAASYPLNVWTHAAGTYDGSTLKYYRNGILESSIAATGSVSYTTEAGTLGNWSTTSPGDAASAFIGKLTDPRIYGRALSATEIQQICSGTEPSTTNRLGYWPLTESSGSFANSGTASSSSLSIFNGAVRDASVPTFLTFGTPIRRRSSQASIRSTF